jgi:hypothetical protein
MVTTSKGPAACCVGALEAHGHPVLVGRGPGLVDRRLVGVDAPHLGVREGPGHGDARPALPAAQVGQPAAGGQRLDGAWSQRRQPLLHQGGREGGPVDGALAPPEVVAVVGEGPPVR